MIGQLRGKLIAKQAPQLLIDVNGVAYEVDAPMSTFYNLPDLQQNLVLHTHFIVREDAQLLYGFHTLEERAMFRALIKVNGVGPRLALSILSSIGPADLALSVANNDSATLVRVPGVGKKTAERLIIELRDKLAKLEIDSHGVGIATESLHMQQNSTQEAVNALIALGYKPQEANKVVKNIAKQAATVEDIIRLALKEMV